MTRKRRFKKLRRWWRKKFRKPYSSAHIPGYSAGGGIGSYVSEITLNTKKRSKPRISRTSTINKSEKTKNIDVSYYIRKLTSSFSGALSGVLKFFIGAMILLLVVGGIRFKISILDKMPNVSEIENADFSQTTLITDRNGEVLYKLFDQNREYIPYESISPNFINALIATEDQSFWTNNGIAYDGVFRAILGQLGVIDFDGGGSTLTQQLLKNLLFTASDSKYKRKVMELFLAGKLNNYLENEVRLKFPDLSKSDIDRKVKEKILELYSNYIFLGNNTYGVEIASQTYFARSAKDLNVLEGAILAGIPQAPSRYDPYTDRAVLMGEIDISRNDDGIDVEIEDALQDAVINKVQDYISKADIGGRKTDNGLLSFVSGLLTFKHTYGGETYSVTYTMGRKDFVLARLYEEKYITEDEFKTAFNESFIYEFGRKNISIKAPHFVFWVMSLLEKQYGDEYLRTGGLTVKTSLDLETQLMAEKSIEENLGNLQSYEANNSALVYLDSHSGDVLAYVGSRDYNNKDIDGEVDLVQASRQPGSIIKPLVYAQGFSKLPLTLDSPIYDVKSKFGENEPENSDGEFRGLTTIRQALAGSRNIPAIKMFLSVGGEIATKNFLYGLGISSLNMDSEVYGYALSLGAAEIPMIEMANAYMHLSAQGKPAEINPILEITKDDNSILYKKKVKVQSQEIPEGVAYLIWSILSDKDNFPASWRTNFTAPGGLNFATKSGTTNVVRGEEKLPRDGWLATYNGEHVLMLRTGNTNGDAMKKNAYGGWLNGPTRRSFLGKLSSAGKIVDSTLEEKDVKSVSISKLTGLLSTYQTPLVFVKKSLGYIKTLPTEYGSGEYNIQIDSFCNGRVSEFTPPEDVVGGVVIKPVTLMPGNYDQQDVKKRWASGGLSSYSSSAGVRLFLSEPTTVCSEREILATEGEISLNILKPTSGQTVTRGFAVMHASKSPFNIKNVKIYLGDVQLKTFDYDQGKEITDITNVTIPPSVADGEYVVRVTVTDEKGFNTSRSVPIVVGGTDNDPPYFDRSNISVKPRADGSYSVILLFGDAASSVKGGTISLSGKTIHTFKNSAAQFVLPNAGTVTYLVEDTSGNALKGTVSLGSNEPAPEPEPTPTPSPTTTPTATPTVPAPEPEPTPTPSPTTTPTATPTEPAPEQEPEPTPEPEEEPAEEDSSLSEGNIDDMVKGLFDE